eukprot:Tbor_TRINITY_DN4849_c0_g1::TRINITY_DN4849_c0_g1_i1::g.1433::m.1433
MWKDQGVGGWIPGQTHKKGSGMKKRSNTSDRLSSDNGSHTRGTSPFLRPQTTSPLCRSTLSGTLPVNTSPNRSPAWDGSSSSLQPSHYGTRAPFVANALPHSVNSKAASNLSVGFVTRGVHEKQQLGANTSIYNGTSFNISKQQTQQLKPSSSSRSRSVQQEIIESQQQPTWVTITGADPGDFHHVLHYFQRHYGPIKRTHWPAVSRRCSWIHVQFFDHAVARYCVEHGSAFTAESNVSGRSEVANQHQIFVSRCHRSSFPRNNIPNISTPKQQSLDVIEVVSSWCKDYAIISKYAEEDFEEAVAMSLLSGGVCTEGDKADGNVEVGDEMKREDTFFVSEGSKSTKSDNKEDENNQADSYPSYSALGRISALVSASLKFKSLKTQPQTTRMDVSLSRAPTTLEQSSIASGDAALSIQRPQHKGAVSSYLFYANNNSSIHASQLSNQQFQQPNGDRICSRGGNRSTVSALSRLFGGSSSHNSGTYSISFMGRYNTISKAEQRNDEVYVPPPEGFNETSGNTINCRSARGLWGHYDLPLLSRWTSNLACFIYSMIGGRHGAEGRTITGRSTLASFKVRDRLDRGDDTNRRYGDSWECQPSSLSTLNVNDEDNLMRFSYGDTEDEDDAVEELLERIQLDREVERDIMSEIQKSSNSDSRFNSLSTSNGTNTQDAQPHHLHISSSAPIIMNQNLQQIIILKKRKLQAEMRKRKTIRYRFFSKKALQKFCRTTKRFFLRHFYYRMPQREVCCSDLGTHSEVHIVLHPETFYLNYVNIISFILLVLFLYFVVWGCAIGPALDFFGRTFCDFWFIATGGEGVSFLGQCSSAHGEESLYQYLLGGPRSGSDWRSFFYTYSQEDHKYRHPVTDPTPSFWSQYDGSAGASGASSTYHDAYGGGVADFYHAIFGSGEHKEPLKSQHDYVFY